jgi:GTPase SAR1 family protein
MKRATAGVSYFRVHTSPQLSNDNPEAKENEKELEEEGIRSAKSTLAEISQDNVKFRESNTVFEKWFDVQLRSELVPMLQETHLVFVDIPGINEANTEQKYKDYVTKNWNTFDVAVVVMDAKQGVNTEDSVFLLNLVKQNNETKKDIPVIILCNKVDDPDDEEQAEMVAEAQREVEKIFNVPCREKALKNIMGNPTKKCDENLSPVFIPISAIHAYINQCASLMSRKSFEEFDPDLLEKIGREQIGRRNWNKLSKEQKLDSVHELIQENYQEGLKDCNFDKVFKTFSHYLGGESKQMQIIEMQIKTSLRAISNDPLPGTISSTVKQVHDSCKILSRISKTDNTLCKVLTDIDPVSEFWKCFATCENSAFETFEASWPNGFHALIGPMKELEMYFAIVMSPEWNEDAAHVLSRMEKFVNRFFSSLVKYQEEDIKTTYIAKKKHYY